ncbi:MAG: STAS/SEC14 domain-containing protein [Bacteroidia bacterium]
MLFFSNYKFRHDLKGDILHVVYSGRIRKKEIEEIMTKIYALLYKHDAQKILIDSLKADVQLEMGHIMQMAKTHPPIFKRAKTAVVEKAKNKAQYELYQTVTENHDLNLRFFNDMKEAEAWLSQ